jgi:hypothetical protein
VAGPQFRQLHFLPITFVLIVVFVFSPNLFLSFRFMSAPTSYLLSTRDSWVAQANFTKPRESLHSLAHTFKKHTVTFLLAYLDTI